MKYTTAGAPPVFLRGLAMSSGADRDVRRLGENAWLAIVGPALCLPRSGASSSQGGTTISALNRAMARTSSAVL